MVPFHVLTRRVFIERLILIALGLIFLLLGIYEGFVSLAPSIELSLAYVAVGMSFISTAYQYRRITYFLSAFVIVSLVTFVAKFALIYSHSSTWFGALWTTVLLAQGFILLKNIKSDSIWRDWASTVLSGAILTMGIFTWTGWFVDVSSYFPWLLPNQMNLINSLSTILIGVGLLTISGISVYKQSDHFPTWIFITTTVIIFVLSISICIAQISSENAFLQTISQEKANNSVSIIKESLGVYEVTLKNALKKIEKEGGDTSEVSEIDFIYSVIAPDELNTVKWVDSNEGEMQTSFTDIVNHDDRLIISLQLEGNELPAGSILSVFHSKNLFQRLFPENLIRNFSIVVTKGHEVIYDNSHHDYRYRDTLGSKKPFTIFHEEWIVEVWPTAHMVVQTQSVIAPTMFLVGGITSFLVGTILYFFFIARNHAFDVEQANKAKNAFLLNISHEVRTPLNGIIGTASLMASTDLSTKQERFVNIIDRSGKLLLNMINDILDISSIESGNLKLQQKEVNLHELINSTTRLFVDSANEKDIELMIDFPKQPAEFIYVDERRFKQVLINLVSTVIKFISNGYVCTRVRMHTIGSDMNLLTVSIQTPGDGIDGKEFSRAFGLFNQNDQKYTQTNTGSLLGLSISKQLIELMGGQVIVRHDEGEVFSLDLQLPVKCLPSSDRISSSNASVLPGKSILIVSGNTKMKEVYIRYAEDWGMIACSAFSIFDVIDMIQENNPESPPLYEYILIDGDSSDVHGKELESLLISKRINHYSTYIQLKRLREKNKASPSVDSILHTIYKPHTTYEFKEAIEALKTPKLSPRLTPNGVRLK